MVWQNRDPNADLTVIEGDEVVKRIDNPLDHSDRSKRSFFDGGNWNADTREQLGIKLFARLEIPNTNKSDMKKFADLLHGLATKMEQTAANTALTEHEANILFRNMVQAANFEMKERANIDLRDQKNRGNPRTQIHRLDTKSS